MKNKILIGSFIAAIIGAVAFYQHAVPPHWGALVGLIICAAYIVAFAFINWRKKMGDGLTEVIERRFKETYKDLKKYAPGMNVFVDIKPDESEIFITYTRGDESMHQTICMEHSTIKDKGFHASTPEILAEFVEGVKA